MNRFIKILAALVAAVTVLTLPQGGICAPARNITAQCRLSIAAKDSSFKKAHDGRLSTVWNGKLAKGQFIGIAIGGKSGFGGLYIRWDAPPPAWKLFGYDGKGGGSVLVAKGGGRGFLAEFVQIPGNFSQWKRFRLYCVNGKAALAITELSVFGAGDAPDYAPQWQQFNGRADIMLFAAHPDDEQIYMGAVLPTCAEMGKSAVTVFMTYGKPLRRFEAMESVWLAGERVYPVMRKAVDKRTYTLKEAQRLWPERETLAFAVEQIRKFKPSVIVTHDTEGEYGHGAHVLTSLIVRKAYDLAGDPRSFPESAGKYGAWKAAKLYLHIYPKNAVSINTRSPLSFFGGKTALRVSQEGYSRHFSQLPGMTLRDYGKYSNRAFGLYASRVGQDKKHDDLFENVTNEAMMALNPGAK